MVTDSSTNFEYGLEIEDTSLSMDLANEVFPETLDSGTQVQSLNDSPDIESRDDNESECTFKFINQVLMESSMDEIASMLHDPLVLQATEQSFYEVISKKYPPSPYIEVNTEYPNTLNETTCETNEDFVVPSLSGDPLNRSIQLVNSENSYRSNSVGQNDSLMNMNLTPSLFGDNEFKLHFRKGMEEARKLLPKIVQEPSEVLVILEKDYSTSSRGRKHLYYHDNDLDTRSSKQSAVYENEDELSEMFDNMFLCDIEGIAVLSSKGSFKFPNGFDKYWQRNHLPRVPINAVPQSKRQKAESDLVDLQSLLLKCAQAAASNDLKGAHQQLKQIKRYASSTGDASQRVANLFANGLEASLAGTGAQMYTDLASKRISFSEMLKAYQVYLSGCPYVLNLKIKANKKILKIAAKGSNLHIVDFGISYGFQWPELIQLLSIRRGGPPKLRITGIDIPQAGFRPAELIEETGQRLAKHCKRFNVPFEYQAIDRHSWETIDIKDLKLMRDEVLVVNCFLRYQDLPQEAVLADSRKDGILNLIRSMKPDLFLHSIINGSYDAPFFMTRFREALYYYASLLDMLDVTVPHSDQQRFHFEKEFGREVLNIIACEEKQRVVRPETYKQWHIRSIQAGFKIIPLEKILGKGCMKARYHKEFLYAEDRNWMLQGWKGRVLYASSCWVPV